MIERRHSSSLLIALAMMLGQAKGQDQASTLDELCRRSTTIAKVKVIAVARDDRGLTRVTLQSQETLAGSDSARFTLHEPGARSCGRALWGLVPGRTYLAFLGQSSTGPTLTISNSRSLAPLEPDLVQHVRRLLTTRGAQQRIALLSQGLISKSARVREDCAMTLPMQAKLDLADGPARSQILAALTESLTKQDQRLFSLLRIATRLRLPQALPVMLEHFLDSQGTGIERALLTMLPKFESQDLMPALTRAHNHDRVSATRILSLLDKISAQEARPLLLVMVGDSQRSISIAAGTCLLRGGYGQSELANLIGEEKSQDCANRIKPERPKFRTILRGSAADGE